MSKIARDLNIKNIEERVFELEKNPGGGISEVPLATDEAVGGFKTGNGVSLNEDGTLNIPDPTISVASDDTLGGIKTSSDKEVTVDSNDVLRVNIPVSTSDTYADYNTNAVTPLQKFLRKIFPYKKANSNDYIGKVYRENVNNEGTLKTKLGPSHEAEFALTNIVNTLVLESLAVPNITPNTNMQTVTVDYTASSFNQNLNDLGSAHTSNNFDNTYPRVFSDSAIMGLDRTNIRFVFKPFANLSAGDMSFFETPTIEVIFSRVDYNKTQNKIVSSSGIFIDGITNAFKKVSFDASIDSTNLLGKKYPFRFTNSLMVNDYRSDGGCSLTPFVSTYTDENTEDHIVVEQRAKFIVYNEDIGYNTDYSADNISKSVKIEIDAFVDRDVYRENYYFIPMSEKVPVTPTT